jgi:hypothetical protein
LRATSPAGRRAYWSHRSRSFGSISDTNWHRVIENLSVSVWIADSGR